MHRRHSQEGIASPARRVVGGEYTLSCQYTSKGQRPPGIVSVAPSGRLAQPLGRVSVARIGQCDCSRQGPPESRARSVTSDRGGRRTDLETDIEVTRMLDRNRFAGSDDVIILMRQFSTWRSLCACQCVPVCLCASGPVGLCACVPVAQAAAAMADTYEMASADGGSSVFASEHEYPAVPPAPAKATDTHTGTPSPCICIVI
jgi:hypothetical protein